jgi:hypothetical protein
LHYVGHEQRHQIVCLQCWRRLTEAIDGGIFQATHGGGPLPFWCDAWRVRHGIPPDEPCPMTAQRLREVTIRAPRPAARADQAARRHIRRQACLTL